MGKVLVVISAIVGMLAWIGLWVLGSLGSKAMQSLWLATIVVYEERRKTPRIWFRTPRNEARALRVFTWVAAIVFAGATWISDADSELGNFRTEATGIAIAVVFIEEVSRRRAYLEFKQSIIQQMASRSNDFALDAARICRNEGWLTDGSLQGVDLAGANLQKADMVNARLQEANLTGTNFQKTKLIGANLQEAMLRGANLQEAMLGGANLQEAMLRGANLQEAVLRGANLRETDLRGANLQKADMKGANLQEADMRAANLQEAVLRHVNLRKADLIYAKFQKADLSGANLQMAVLISAKLQEADLSGAKLQRAIYSENTQWPRGFDPIASGAILKNQHG